MIHTFIAKNAVDTIYGPFTDVDLKSKEVHPDFNAALQARNMVPADCLEVFIPESRQENANHTQDDMVAAFVWPIQRGDATTPIESFAPRAVAAALLIMTGINIVSTLAVGAASLVRSPAYDGTLLREVEAQSTKIDI